MRSVARIPSQCATCRKQSSLEVSQEIRDGQLKWVEAFSCTCGHGFEAGGAGLPPPGVRKAMMTQSGLGQVWLDEEKSRPVVFKLLTAMFGVKEDVAKKQLEKLPALAFEGTHAEASFIAQALERVKATVRLVTLPPTQPSAGTKT